MIFLFSNKFIYLFFIVIFFQGITYFDISYTIFNLLLLFDYIDTFYTHYILTVSHQHCNAICSVNCSRKWNSQNTLFCRHIVYRTVQVVVCTIPVRYWSSLQYCIALPVRLVSHSCRRITNYHYTQCSSHTAYVATKHRCRRSSFT